MAHIEGSIQVPRLTLSSPGRNLSDGDLIAFLTVSYTHLRAHETVLDLVCRLLLEQKKKQQKKIKKKEKHTIESSYYIQYAISH